MLAALTLIVASEPIVPAKLPSFWLKIWEVSVALSIDGTGKIN